jgi:hypothetical protein
MTRINAADVSISPDDGQEVARGCVGMRSIYRLSPGGVLERPCDESRPDEVTVRLSNHWDWATLRPQ